MRPLAAAILAAFALIGAFVAPVRADPTFPPLTGRVVDDAQILKPDTRAELTDKLAALETKTGDQVVVVTLPSLQGYAIEDYGYQLGRAWGVGQKGKNNGVLLIVAPNERKVRIEVGYGLEPVLTDALSSVIIQETILPAFRQGQMDAGVKAGAEAVIDQLSLDPDAAKAKAAAAQTAPAPSVRFPLILTLIIVFVLLRLLFGRGAGILPFLFIGGGGFRDNDGFGGGGGGFSGGGGSFGGGGASGGW